MRGTIIDRRSAFRNGLALWAVMGGLVASVQAAPGQKTLLQVTASTRAPSINLGGVQIGDTLSVEIIEINTFREKYAIEFNGVDYYTMPVPDLLKLSVPVTQAAYSPVEQLSNVNNVMGTLSKANHARADSLLQEWSRVRSAFEKLELYMLATTQGGSAAEVLHRQLVAMRSNAEAESVASACVDSIQIRWGLDLSSAASSALLDAFDQESIGLKNDWYAVTRRWQVTHIQWQVGPEHSSEQVTAAKLLATDVADLEGRARTIMTRLDTLRIELEKFTTLVRLARDPVRTPLKLERSVIAEKDEIVASVSIEPFPVAAEGAKQEAEPFGTYFKSVRVPVSGRWLVSFSGGLARTDLFNRHYVSAPSVDTTGTGRRVVSGARDRIDLHPAVFAHYLYTFRCGGLKLAAGPTLGLTTGDPARYLCGGASVIGRSVRLGLSGGLSAGKVEALHGERPERQLVNEPLATKQVMRVGSFYSVSFAVSSLPGLGSKKSEESDREE